MAVFSIFRNEKPTKIQVATQRNVARGQISVSESEVRENISFSGVTEEDLGLVHSWEDVFHKCSDRLIDAFYAHIGKNARANAVVAKHTTVERQRPGVTRYITSMFGGRIDDQYVSMRNHVGALHDNIDLDTNLYVAMYDVIEAIIVEELHENHATNEDIVAFRASFGRLVNLDIALVLAATIESRRVKILKSAEESIRLTDSATEVFKKVSNRDLTARMQGDFHGQLATLKDSINETLQILESAMMSVVVSADEVSTASKEISSGSQSLASGASEQASSIEEVSSSLQEVASMARRNANSAQEARALTDTTQKSCVTGRESMSKMSDAISKIKASADETAKIVKTIDEIAFQTNLLALNAAVEAARAGDAGRGFAVVAEEVRNLAMRSAEAAKSTAELIEHSVKNAEGGVSINGEVLRSLEEISGQVAKVSEVMSEIAAASDNQSRSVDEVNSAVEQMNLVTQQVAATAEESASASEELSGQANELLSLTAEFKLSHSDSPKGRPSSAPKRVTASPYQAPKPAKKVAANAGQGHIDSSAYESEFPLEDDNDELSKF